jgi:hypothetical protein
VKVEAHVLLIIGAFFAVVGLVYWFWSLEQGGAAMLAGSAALGLVPGAYYLWWAHRMKPRAEDRKDATLGDGAGVIGAFPSSSIWPFVLGLAALLVAMSLVFGFWTAPVGFVLAVAGAIGYVVESRRGGVV